MGNFVNIAWRGIKWIGNCIHKIISWWGAFKEGVNQNTYNFLIGKQNEIMNTNNPRGVGEVIAIKSEKDQLEDIAERQYQSLSYDDQARVDELLSRRDY
jgi:hypothetical protein